MGGTSGDASGDADGLARRVINGEFGNGDARRAAPGSRYDEVQARVNQLLVTGSSGGVGVVALARAVIRGNYGNGEERRRRLGDNFEAVQRRVDETLL